jgi:hypothetical protein
MTSSRATTLRPWSRAALHQTRPLSPDPVGGPLKVHQVMPTPVNRPAWFSSEVALAFFSSIDVEQPAFRSSQHAVGMSFPVSLAPGATTQARLTLALHMRYPRPTLNSSHPYHYAQLSAPVALVRCPAVLDQEEWMLLREDASPPTLIMRVPAGRVADQVFVRYLTMASSLLGSVIVTVALLRSPFAKLPWWPGKEKAA